MATFTVNDRPALAGASTATDDQFLIWDTSAGTHKKISRGELKAAFMGGGNVSSNLGFGAAALTANTTGQQNTALGAFALTATTIGAYNVAVGSNALYSNSTGQQNVAVGAGALFASTVATKNTAVGMQALTAVTYAGDNTGIGYNALSSVLTGAANTAIGSGAGSNITAGNNNVCIGWNAQASSASASNEVTIGNSSIATIRAQVTTITSLSDQRDKKNIRPFNLGLAFLLSVYPKWFEWNMRPEIDSDGNEIRGKVDITEGGFIAQQLQEAVQAHLGEGNETGAEALGLVFDTNPDRLEATPGKLMPVFVKAFHDIKAMIDAHSARLDALEPA